MEMYRHGIAYFRDLGNVSARLLYPLDVRNFREPRQRTRLDIRTSSARNVVEDYGFIDSFGDGAKMTILTFLRRFVVVRRCGKYGIHAGPRRSFSCFCYGLSGR